MAAMSCQRGMDLYFTQTSSNVLALELERIFLRSYPNDPLSQSCDIIQDYQDYQARSIHENTIIVSRQGKNQMLINTPSRSSSDDQASS